MARPDEDKWEYEYDENETEDFYIPIDLANVPAIQGALGMGGPAQRGHPTLLKTKLRALNTERREAGSNVAVQNVEDAEESIGRLQLIGLHTENPLMMYNGQLLCCEWNKTIGTDLMFAKPSYGGEAGEPLRSLPSVDLLATSSARLVARVARMRPRDDLFDEVPRVQQNSNEAEVSRVEQESSEVMDTSGDAAPVAPSDDVAIGETAPVDTSENHATSTTRAPPTRPVPSRFLDRLNAIKARRGESPILPDARGGSQIAAASSSAAGDDTVMGGT